MKLFAETDGVFLELQSLTCFITGVPCVLLKVYCIGTVLSMQISFVGFQPVQSSEHMAVCIDHFVTFFFFVDNCSLLISFHSLKENYAMVVK